MPDHNAPEPKAASSPSLSVDKNGTFPKRRRADNPLANWHKWSAAALCVALAFLAGQLLYMRSFEAIRLTLNAFFGAVLAVVVCYGAVAKQIFDNLEKMVKTGADINAGLEDRLEQEKTDRKTESGNIEARYQAEIAGIEARCQENVARLTLRVENLNAVLQQTLEEKFNLEEMLRAIRRDGKHRPRILLIDDNAEHLKMHSYFLELGEFEVVAARSGVEGVRLYEEAAEKPFAAVICDVAMPDLSGLSGEDVVKLLKLHGRPNVKIAMLTGFNADAVSPFFEQEKIPVWSKPVSQADLVSKVRHLIDGGRC